MDPLVLIRARQREIYDDIEENGKLTRGDSIASWNWFMADLPQDPRSFRNLASKAGMDPESMRNTLRSHYEAHRVTP